MTRPDPMNLEAWIGRTERREDRVTPFPMAALAATLDLDMPVPREGDPVPPLWHWLWFLPTDRRRNLGPEGHPDTGALLPPAPLPRRMWAGGDLEFRRPLRVGQQITRTSVITDISEKEGRTGRLIFVRVHHDIAGDEGLAVVEDQNLVFRAKASPDGPAPVDRHGPGSPDWSREVEPDEILLFRYSALTFNAHRIHYDRRYASGTGGYPGLVVHGPLIATLLVDLVRRNLPDATLRSFRFRAVSPLFDTETFRLCGKRTGGDGVSLWAEDSSGVLAMTADAVLASA